MSISTSCQRALLAFPTTGAKVKDSPSNRLWLLAHFIGIQKAKAGEALHLLYLKALYTHLSALLNLVRDGIKTASGTAEPTQEAPASTSVTLPPYVLEQLRSLA